MSCKKELLEKVFAMLDQMSTVTPITIGTRYRTTYSNSQLNHQGWWLEAEKDPGGAVDTTYELFNNQLVERSWYNGDSSSFSWALNGSVLCEKYIRRLNGVDVKTQILGVDVEESEYDAPRHSCEYGVQDQIKQYALDLGIDVV